VIDSYGGKYNEKKQVLRREWRMPQEKSTIDLRSEHDDGEKLGDDEGSK